MSGYGLFILYIHTYVCMYVCTYVCMYVRTYVCALLPPYQYCDVYTSWICHIVCTSAGQVQAGRQQNEWLFLLTIFAVFPYICIAFHSGEYRRDLWMLNGTVEGSQPFTPLCSRIWFSYAHLHGLLMGLPWGVLLPLGFFIARYYRTKGPLWFILHLTLQVSTAVEGSPVWTKGCVCVCECVCVCVRMCVHACMCLCVCINVCVVCVCVCIYIYIPLPW